MIHALLLGLLITAQLPQRLRDEPAFKAPPQSLQLSIEPGCAVYKKGETHLPNVPPCVTQTIPKEKPPEALRNQNFARPVCGWNGDLQQDGKCHVRIVFTTDYPPITCKVRKALPEENHQDEGQIIDCTWEPVK